MWWSLSWSLYSSWLKSSMFTMVNGTMFTFRKFTITVCFWWYYVAPTTTKVIYLLFVVLGLMSSRSFLVWLALLWWRPLLNCFKLKNWVLFKLCPIWQRTKTVNIGGSATSRLTRIFLTRFFFLHRLKTHSNSRVT